MDLKELETIYFSVEGDVSVNNENVPIINLMNKLENKYFIREKDTSSDYHLANVFVSNLVLSLLEIGTSYLKDMGLSEKEALNAIYPLITGNIKNISEKGFMDSLTGPVVRGDVNTIKRHLGSVKQSDKEIYKELSLNLLKLVQIKNAKNMSTEAFASTSKKYSEINQLLGGIE